MKAYTSTSHERGHTIMRTYTSAGLVKGSNRLYNRAMRPSNVGPLLASIKSFRDRQPITRLWPQTKGFRRHFPPKKRTLLPPADALADIGARPHQSTREKDIERDVVSRVLRLSRTNR